MGDFTLTLGEGETLLHGLLRGGAALAHDCGGKLACASCRVVVSEGELSPPGEDELDMLERAGVAQEGARLACQAFGPGNLVVRVPRLEARSPQGMLPVAMTDEAAAFLALQLRKHPGAAGMRLAVSPAGCSGLRYRVEPAELVRQDDAVFECAGVRIAVDRASLPFLQGTTLRLAREGLATRLRFDNPNAGQSCGCGESFAPAAS